jgi:hypothetical protein
MANANSDRERSNAIKIFESEVGKTTTKIPLHNIENLQYYLEKRIERLIKDASTKNIIQYLASARHIIHQRLIGRTQELKRLLYLIHRTVDSLTIKEDIQH